MDAVASFPKYTYAHLHPQLSRSDILRKREKTECSHKVAGDETCSENQSRLTNTNASAQGCSGSGWSLNTMKIYMNV